MKPVQQKYIHIEGKQNGDCLRACLASILEVDIDTFPYFSIGMDWSEYYSNVMDTLFDLGWQCDYYIIENCKPELLESKDTEGLIIAIGESPRSTKEKRINHAVIWRNGLIHDPHPDNTGIKDIIGFEVLTATADKQIKR